MTPLESAQLECVRPRANLLEDSEFLAGLLHGMRCGVLSIETRGRLVSLNAHGCRILDLASAPRSGTLLRQALPRHPRLVQVLLESFRMTSLPNRAELELDPGPRGRRSIGFTLSLVRGQDGAPRGAAMFFKDLIPIEHKEEQERLRDRLAALGQMAASLAHEIRNPLASIEVSCNLLQRRMGQDEACRELLTKVTAEVRRLNRSVDSCLAYVRPVSPTFSSSELVPLLEEAIGIAAGRRGGPAIEIRRRFARMPPFLMDRALLGQVFVNLLLNALEAVGEAGRVTVEAELVDGPEAASIPYQPPGCAGDPWSQAERFAVVRVSDTGPGIREEDRDRIFQPFFTTKAQGSGVGLAAAKKIVGGHRGTIEVTGNEAGGAQFVVRLPVVPRLTED